jgi:short-subunit dehydrogenase involved in D-alanine esterification of teichoic acids
MKDFAEKTAVITGGGTGMGRDLGTRRNRPCEHSAQDRNELAP